MHKLHRFFEAKIANHLKYRVTTGNQFFAEVYQRIYKMEVITVDEDGVGLLVTSSDVTQTGISKGGTAKGFGTVNVPFGDSVESMIQSAAVGADPTFFKKYPDVVGEAA